MDSKLQKKLEENIDCLIKEVKKYDTESVLGYISSQLLLSLDNIFDYTKLSSPYKQYLYLAGLLMSNEKNEELQEFNEENTLFIKELLKDISMHYAMMYFPTEEEFKKNVNDKWKEARSVSMPAFLHYFNTASLNYPEQQIERIKRWFIPYDTFFKENYSISVNEFVNIYSFIEDYLQDNFKRIRKDMEYIDKHRKFFLNQHQNGKLSFEGILTLTQQLLGERSKRLSKNISLINHVSVEQLKNKFENDKVENFIKYFTIKRENKSFRYYTQKNPFESFPIWYKSDEYLFVPIVKQILNAILYFLEEKITDSNFKDSFYYHRGKSVENQVEEIFKSLFKDNAEFYTSVYESNESQDEHDLVIIYNDNLLIIESKASNLREPFRDPDKAFIRINSDFKSDSGIQKAYDQGVKLKEKIKSSSQTTLYNQNGEEIKTLSRSEINQIYIICITSEDWGMLACNLSLLLEKESEEPYPWACNLYNLELLVDGFLYKDIGISGFLKYLDQREAYHDKLFASDELEIAGVFINEDGLEKIGENKMDIISFTPDMSDIFDEIYFHKKGIDYPDQNKGETVLVDIQKELGLK